MHNDFVYPSQMEGFPRGLVNLGNTCYMNSIIQCMNNCDYLTKFLCGDLFEKCVLLTGINQGFVCQSVRDVFKALEDRSKEAFVADTFLGVVSASWSAFEAGRQMDAAEFLSYLLSALHGDLLLKPEIVKYVKTGDLAIDAVTAWENSSLSAVSHLFHIQIIGRHWCPKCPHSSAEYGDVNNTITVEVPSAANVSLEDCLQHYFMEENLEDAKCDRCSSKGLKHKLILGRLPPVLIVHLKRFKRTLTGSLQKINKKVNFSDTLDLKKFCVPSLQSSSTYNLKSVVNHHGHTLNNGHYTALSKRGDRWFNYNDTQVTSTSSSSSNRHLCTSNAYILFFEQQAADDNNNNKLAFDLQASQDTLMKMYQTKDLGVPEKKTDTEDFSQDMFNDEVPPELDAKNISSSDEDSDENIDHDQLSWRTASDLVFHDNDNLSGTSLKNGTDPSAHNSTPIGSHKDSRISSQINGNFCATSQSSANTVSQCNHPNFDLDILDPVLTEDDVPGAKLDLEMLNKYNLEQLKWWLACRGLGQKGVKKALIQRIKNHNQQQRGGKIYPGVGKGKWYEAKRKKVMEEAYDSNKKYPMMPTGAVWKPFPSVHIPNKYSTDMALNYLKAIPLWRFSLNQGVTTVKEGDKDCDSDSDDADLFDLTQPSQDERKNIFVNGTLKRATNFLDSGRVLTVHDCQKDNHYCVKSEVQASLRKQSYIVCIMISTAKGAICFAECCCKARALARCCHIFAVLLLISRHIDRHGNEAITSTGRRCYWLLPGTSVVRAPGVVRDKTEYYPKVDYHRRGHFDPRPTASQTDDNLEGVTKLMDRLQTLSVSAPCLWSYHLIQPPTMPDGEEIFPDVSATLDVAEMCSYMLWNLNLINMVSNNQPLHLPLTMHQSLSTAWKYERAIRITASKATQMLGLESSRSTVNGKINALRKHIWGLDPFLNDDMEEGMRMEPLARQAYTSEIKKTHPEWDVIETGMWVNPKHPQLSCSPDGIVVDVNGFVKLLEVKCPAVLKNIDPENFETLSESQLKNFCLKRNRESGKIELRQSHKWYVQVQMSLDILQLQECDFVIYSETEKVPNKILILTIPYNDAFWNERRERLKRIHRELIIPEFFLYNTVFKRQPKFLVYSPFHEEHDDCYFWFGEKPENTYTLENENEVLITAQAVKLSLKCKKEPSR